MNRTDLTTLKDLLQNWRDDLLGGAHRTAGGMSEQEAVFADPTDRATLEGEQGLTLRIRDRERKLITKIDEALGRIHDGTFGLCEECGGDISVDRLKVRPVTTLCIECKAEQEQREARRIR